MLWAVATIFAAEVDLLTDDAVAQAAAGRCAVVERRLQSRVDRNPDDLAARLALNACRIGGTERATGERDLASLYQVGGPFDPARLVPSVALDPKQRGRLVSDAQLAASFVVRAWVAANALPQAQQAFSQLEARVGLGPSLAAAQIGLERSQNGAAVGWRFAIDATERFPESLEVLDEVGVLAFDDLRPAPAALIDAVLVRGRPTAKLNVLYGFARAGRGAECLLKSEQLGVDAEWTEQLRRARYRCAAAAGDLAAADSIAATGVSEFDPRLRGEHAALRLAAGRAEDALALVRGVESNDARTTEVTVRALSALGRRSELSAFARGLPAGSTPRLSAAVVLFNAGDVSSAKALVAGTCTAYQAENAVICSRME